MASWNPENDVEITDSEEEDDDSAYFRGRQAFIYVVDAGLYESIERFEEALRILRSAFISGLLINDKDLLGVVFANTEHSPEPLEKSALKNIVVPKNCAVFLPVRQLSKAIVEHLMNFVLLIKDKFMPMYGVSPGNFTQMIRLCCNLFENCGYKLNYVTIVYMTDKETPHRPGSVEYQNALRKAKDLSGLDVEFHLIPMVDDFNYDVFYKEFLTLARDLELDSFEPPDAQKLREILADRKLRQDFSKRTLSHFIFSLGPGLDISVQYYNYFKKRHLPRKVKLLRKDNSIVKQKRHVIVRTPNAESLDYDERIVKCNSGWYELYVGGTIIRVTLEQINRVRNLHPPGMLLLGFKPLDSMPENLHYRSSNFMYPDDIKIAGSKRLFRALWEGCLRREKVAICLFLSRRKGAPRYVALVPVQAHTSYQLPCNSLLSGDGFKMVYLPLANHMRHIDFQDWNSIENTASDAGVELFKKVIKKLRINYTPDLINDTELQSIQAKLLALTFNVHLPNEGRFKMPDTEEQDKRVSAVLPENLSEVFGEDPVEVAKKRAAAGESAAGSSRMAKVPKITEDVLYDYEQVKEIAAKKQLANCTLPQLLIILQTHFAITKKYKKQEALDIIYQKFS